MRSDASDAELGNCKGQLLQHLTSILLVKLDQALPAKQ